MLGKCKMGEENLTLPQSVSGISSTLNMRLGLKGLYWAHIITSPLTHNQRNNDVLRQLSSRVKTICTSLQCGVFPSDFKG